MPVDTALIESLLAPVAGDDPAGKDLRYDPRYDQIKEARREDLELPPGGLATERKVADWPLVTKLAQSLLAAETKDLQLSAWLTEALLKRDGLSGLATGLDATHGMLDRFWESCFPEWDEEDPELRAGPLEWLGTKLDIGVRQIEVAPKTTLLDYQISRGVPTESEAESSDDKSSARQEAIADGKPIPEDVDRAVSGAPKSYYKALVADVDAAIASVTGLERASDERFGRDGPSFSKLRGALDELRRVATSVLAQKLVEDPDPVAEETSDVGAYEPPAGWTGEGDGTMPAEPVSAADAAARVAAAARYLRKQNSANPSPYLMLRGLRWGELRGTVGEMNAKLLEAPATAVRARLKGLLLDGKWSDLLEQCETVMATPHGRGWLDLQRYVLTACDMLGGGHDAVAAAVRSELRALLTAFPQLPEMTLMDDTPTANAETRAWLETEGLLEAPNADGAEPTEESDSEIADQTESLDGALSEDDATSEYGGLRAGTRRRASANGAPRAARDPFVQARSELAQGRPNRAIELLLAELARERSPRGRFVRETQIAYVMVEAGLDVVARPILEQLAATIDERGLENWEAGPLVAQPMALLCRVIDRLDGEGSEQRAGLYLRVCRLDPLQAIALQRGA